MKISSLSLHSDRVMLCCFIADQYADHSNSGNYGVHLLGAEDAQLPGNLQKSTAFDILYQETLKQRKANKQVSQQTKSSFYFREGQ